MQTYWDLKLENDWINLIFEFEFYYISVAKNMHFLVANKHNYLEHFW